MLTSECLSTQLDEASEDRIRVLVVGAGVAGVTAAALLRRSGLHPVVAERSERSTDHGYMLALLPLVDPAIDELGVRTAYLDSSVRLGRYGFRAHTGGKLREDSLAGISARFGDYRGISRGELIEVLAADGVRVSLATIVTEIRDSGEHVDVTLRSGREETEARFDMVIAADGSHSATRELVRGARTAATVDTGWGGWVVWAAADADTDLVEELWGANFFIGSYPVRGGVGAFVGGPREATRAGAASFAEQVRGKLSSRDDRLSTILDTVARAADPYYWSLADCRAGTWANGRVVLLGDAAAGFLPTAGIGAAMAIESAWVLATRLRAADAATVPALLRDYERAQRPRVESAQTTSRRLALLMFRRNRVVATLRDLLMRTVSIEVVLGSIKKLLAAGPSADVRGAARR